MLVHVSKDEAMDMKEKGRRRCAVLKDLSSVFSCCALWKHLIVSHKVHLK